MSEIDEELQLLADAFPQVEEPDDKAWQLVFDRVSQAAEAERRNSVTPTAHRNRRNPRRLAVTFAVGVAVVLVVGVVLALPNSRPGQLRTQPSSWHLVSTIGLTAFRSSPGTQSPDSITCPTTTACYVVASTLVAMPGVKGGTGAAGDEFPVATAGYASTNGGTSWQPLNMPPGIQLLTSFTCPTAETCMVGAQPLPSNSAGATNQQLLLSTDNGGGSWTERRIPMPPLPGPDETLITPGEVGSLTQLICFSSSTCFVFGTVPSASEAQPTGSGNPVYRTVFMRTDDGGDQWSTFIFPWMANPSGAPAWSNAEAGSFSCPTENTCLGLTPVLSMPQAGSQTISTLEWQTQDGGNTWSNRWERYPASGILSCADVLHCVGLGFTSDVAGPQQGSTIIQTTDGGSTWKDLPFPAGYETLLDSISCPTDRDCWAAGTLNQSNTLVPVILVSHDAGATWTDEALPSDVNDVTDINCPSSSSCLAVAASEGRNSISNEQILSNVASSTSSTSSTKA